MSYIMLTYMKCLGVQGIRGCLIKRSVAVSFFYAVSCMLSKYDKTSLDSTSPDPPLIQQITTNYLTDDDRRSFKTWLVVIYKVSFFEYCRKD